MTFSIESLDSTTAEYINNLKINKMCMQIAASRLKLVNVVHIDFNNKIMPGHIIALDFLAENVMNIFKELLNVKFPINSVHLISKYQNNDELSMQANNSSGFNFRNIEGTNKLSMHAYGAAIDINPLQNPYIIFDSEKKISKIYPSCGGKFLDRSIKAPGMVEDVVDIFAKYGFTEWGGNWNDVKDYHHFQIKRSELDGAVKKN